ncbi:CHAT domain-containing protein [Nocardiopsis sp. L17-MgMaSL7]|uniref:CHAT domain-containing protein n=1 Tax=Nocardiopsis sp. L17-MgMaSL7 TaxID=1938893 RepID=UPI000D9B5FD9|nr:CHAT domain-containing protein [Nocardiopsis sp. L17-MgMaSL7]PWV57452.1 CHAT domain-containing protein [Nocardiopsis sp. L17-MgMaSL7]
MLPSATPARSTTSPPPDDPPFLATGRALLAQVTQGVRLAQTGRFDQTVVLLDDSRRRLRGHPVSELDPVLPGVLTDLGLAQTMCGRFGPAADHLNEALSLADERRLPLLGLVARHNLGCLDLYRGDTAAALTTFHELTHQMPDDRQDPLRVDLAEALLAVGLVEEAGRVLAEAPWRADEDDTARVLVEAKLRLLEGDRSGALHLTRKVRAGLGPGSLWHRLAGRLEGVAEAATRSPAPARRARDLLELRVPAVAQPFADGPAGCTGDSGGVAGTGVAGGAEGAGAAGVADRAGVAGGGGDGFRNAWDVAGRRGTLTDARRALDRLAERGAPAPGPWLGSADRDPHVIRAGLESSLLAGDPATALEWAEMSHTWADGLAPAPDTAAAPRMADPTGRYRLALGRGAGPEAHHHARRWESAHWRAPRTEDGGARQHRLPVLEALMERLGGRAFVHYAVAGSEAVALVAVAGQVHARELGPLVRIRRALGRFVHERNVPLPHARSAARTGPLRLPGPPGNAARSSPADLVSSTLLGPILPVVGDRPLVVTAAPYLGDLPWGQLPALRGRPLRLVSTARSWAERPATRPSRDRVLLVCGPEPRMARLEVGALAGVHPGARVLVRAGQARVLDALAQCDLAHLAGHGSVGDRTPMLGRFDLHDGPLLACDLAALPAAPALAVLSSCWGGHGFGGAPGRSGGFVGALLARGTRTVVASPVPVDDERTGVAMRAFHRALTDGTEVSEAVAEHLGHLGFCCYGA